MSKLWLLPKISWYSVNHVSGEKSVSAVDIMVDT